MPSSSEVRLCQRTLDGLPAKLSTLSPDEAGRAARFHFEIDRQRFVVCRTALREILGEALGIAPGEVTFSYGAHGKPALAQETGVRFNVAHAGGRALIALSEDGRELGVDLEEVRPERATDDVARAVFTESERAQLVGPERVERFFQLWTRKEAYLKAIGEGFASPSLEIPDAWEIREIPVEPGFKAALAVQPGLPWRVRVS
jgi:4'-phosphopantetheinyl transferase